MSNNKEQECIQKSLEAKIANAESQLADLQTNGISFDSPISDLRVGIEWRKKTSEIIKQVLFIPIAIILILFLVFMAAVEYILQLWVVRNKKHELAREISELSRFVPKEDVLQEKTLESLWQLHGLSKYKYTSNERLGLVTDWIRILYGNAVANDLHLEKRVSEIASRQVKANLPYYEGKGDAAHYSFVSPVDSLVRELSGKLPKYG